MTGIIKVPVRGLIFGRKFNVSRPEAKRAFIKGFVSNAKRDRKIFARRGITKIKFVDPKGKDIVRRI